MKRESFARKRLYPIGFMLAVTLVFISVTSMIYTLTGERIQLNEMVRLRRAVLYASGAELPNDPAEIDSMYQSRVTEVPGSDGRLSYYQVRDDSGDVSGYVLIRSGAGLWGEITAAVGFDADLTSLRGMEILDQNETPGLGGRIDETWFKEQFRGKVPPLESVPEGSPSTESQFDAITGATYSTGAIREILNDSAVYILGAVSPAGAVH